MELNRKEKEVITVKRTAERQGISKKEFLKNAKKRGTVVYKNNIHKAKPLSEISGHIVAKEEYSPEELVCR